MMMKKSYLNDEDRMKFHPGTVLPMLSIMGMEPHPELMPLEVVLGMLMSDHGMISLIHIITKNMLGLKNEKCILHTMIAEVICIPEMLIRKNGTITNVTLIINSNSEKIRTHEVTLIPMRTMVLHMLVDCKKETIDPITDLKIGMMKGMTKTKDMAIVNHKCHPQRHHKVTDFNFLNLTEAVPKLRVTKEKDLLQLPQLPKVIKTWVRLSS